MEYNTISAKDKGSAAGKIDVYTEKDDPYSALCLCGPCGCACFCLCFGVANADPERSKETEDADLEKELFVNV